MRFLRAPLRWCVSHLSLLEVELLGQRGKPVVRSGLHAVGFISLCVGERREVGTGKVELGEGQTMVGEEKLNVVESCDDSPVLSCEIAPGVSNVDELIDESLPEVERVLAVAVHEDLGEEASQLRGSAEEHSLVQAVMILFLVVHELQFLRSFLEGRAERAIDGSQLVEARHSRPKHGEETDGVLFQGTGVDGVQSRHLPFHEPLVLLELP